MKRMIRTTAMILATGLAGCSLSGQSEAPPPIAVQPDRSSVCTAIAPTYPLPQVTYSESGDTPVTVALAKKNNLKYREANARYNAACK